MVKKMLRLSYTVEFAEDKELSSPGRPVGTETISVNVAYVFYLGETPKTPSKNCRRVVVEKKTFFKYELGQKYQPQTGDTVEPPEKPSQ